MAKKTSPYFTDFITMVNLSCKAAKYLQSSLNDFMPETLEKCRNEMHDIEHEEDKIKHIMISRLVKEFVPPIDREDIIQLANELDTVTDKIDDIFIRMDMYGVRRIRPASHDFADVIVNCCNALQLAMVEFPNFQKSTTLKQAIIDVNSMEEQGDAIYLDAMRTLYAEGGDPIEIAVWSELFDRFEECCDACEHVADLMEIIVMKNS